MNAGKKLLLNERVEVRQVEEGLRGSWYQAVVVGISEFCRRVKYDELLCESGKSKLIESIPVTGEIEGVYRRSNAKSKHRARIRPPPPSPVEECSAGSKLRFGVCVDALYQDAWWEGVIFDFDDGSNERSVFFPDEGDEHRFKVCELRVSHDWDEFSGDWNERGTWVLVKLAEEHKLDVPLCQFIKRAWCHLRVNYGFLKMISEWNCGSYYLWKQYFIEVVCEIGTKSSRRSIGYPSSSRVCAVIKSENRVQRSICGQTDEGITKGRCKEMSDILPIDDNHVESVKVASFVAGKDHRFSTQVTKPGNLSVGKGGNNLADVLPEHDNGLASSVHIATSHYCVQANNVTHPRNKIRMINELKRLKPSVSHTRRVKRYCYNMVQELKNARLLRGQGYSVAKKGNLIPKSIRSTRSSRSRGRCGWIDCGLSNQKYHQKTKNRVRKRICDSNVKSTLLSKKEEEVPESVQKEDHILDHPSYVDLPSPSSVEENRLEDMASSIQKRRTKRSKQCDSVCFICQYGGDLLPCDHCLSSYHLTCIGLKDVPAGKWYCPSCRCGFCGSGNPIADEVFTKSCYQCSHRYHVDCRNKAGVPFSDGSVANKFCTQRCFKIYARLHELLQTSNPTSVEGLRWTLTRSRRNYCNIFYERVHHRVQLSQVLNTFHECFQPIVEPQSGRDLVAEVVYNSWSKFHRLDFHGFYVMALLKDEEVTCAATVRIHGHKVAEMPLIATPFKYRRKGMCRLLVHELEKILIEMGVERLVLPAISQLSETWVSSFDFKEIPTDLRQELSGFPFLNFQGTTLFQKVLNQSNLGSCSSSSLVGPESTKSGVNQKSFSNPHKDRKFTLHYSRRHKCCCRENRELKESGKNNDTLRYVYKRRRVMASKDPVHVN